MWVFLILLPGMDLASHRLNASTCPMTEPHALRGRIILVRKEKYIPLYTTGMDPPMTGTSWPETQNSRSFTRAATTTSYKPDAGSFHLVARGH